MIKIILIVGKSGSGKDTIKKELMKLGFYSVVSYTTRSPREGEIDGEAYHFISEEEFLQKKEEGFFAETTSYNTIYGVKYYGAAKCDLTEDKAFIVNPDGLKAIYNMKELNPISFLISVDESVLKQRLSKRGDDPGEVIRRLNCDEDDFADIDEYIDYSFKNNGELKPRAIAEMIAYTYKKRLESE